MNKKLEKQLRAIRKDPNLKPDKIWKNALLQELREEIYPRKAWYKNFGIFFKPQFATIRVLASFVLVFFVGGGGLVFASQSSIPGDILYPIKTATEEVERFVAITPEKKMAVNTKIAEKRTKELEKLVEVNAESKLIKAASVKIAQETETIMKEIKNNPKMSEETLKVAQKAISENIVTLKEATIRVSIKPKTTEKLDTSAIPEEIKPKETTVKTPRSDEVGTTEEPIKAEVEISTNEPENIGTINIIEASKDEESSVFELIESIQSLEEAAGEVEYRQIEIATEEKRIEKVEQKIETIKEEITLKEENIKNIADPNQQKEAQDLINQAKIKIEESEMQLRDTKVIDSFEGAVESNKTLGEVEKIAPETILMPTRPGIKEKPTMETGTKPTTGGVNTDPAPETNETKLKTSEPITIIEPLDPVTSDPLPLAPEEPKKVSPPIIIEEGKPSLAPGTSIETKDIPITTRTR